MQYIYSAFRITVRQKAKLKSLNLDGKSCEEILADIFGKTSSEMIQLGLVGSVDPTDFTKKLRGKA